MCSDETSQRRLDEALRIVSGHVLTRCLAGVVLRDAGYAGYQWRLEHRVGGAVISQPATAYRTSADALVALKVAAYAHQLSLDVEQTTDEE
jgi:hypothetical protein